jgi:hypothetical protein
MKLRLKRLLAAAFIVVGITSIQLASPAVALDVPCNTGGGAECNLVKADKNLDTRVWYIVRTALTMIGGVAIIVIIIGGILYAISNGDAGKAKTAKNTILYAVVGLVVAMSASAIVTLVNNALK